jgi:3-deoxy-manno-octulosonate cytidylyltransferase (CMP-KDO synthetase)
MKFIGIIPARFESSRFPGKPLHMISGKSMIQRVYEQCNLAGTLDDLIVATDDERIVQHVKSFGGNVVLTSATHKCGTERCNEAISILNTNGIYCNEDVVINIQGDEPLINPIQISLVSSSFKKKGVEIATLARKISNTIDIFNPNTIKVVFNNYNEALYFSRSPIPYKRGVIENEWILSENYYKHIGIYAYKIGVLKKITMFPPSKLELSESLEQLRWLENGIIINVAITDHDSHSVDIPEDVTTIEKLIAKDSK